MYCSYHRAVPRSLPSLPNGWIRETTEALLSWRVDLLKTQGGGHALYPWSRTVPIALATLDTDAKCHIVQALSCSVPSLFDIVIPGEARGNGASNSGSPPGISVLPLRSVYSHLTSRSEAIVARNVLDIHDDAVADDKIDERHLGRHCQAQQRGRLEIGEENAQSCTRWISEKILEHAGFQGTSRAALDVLNGVFSEFMLNMGRSIRFLTDKYSKTMTPEEIILHTLFESGVSKVQEMERYITDDIERNGTRLLELEKKLVNAYREVTAGDVLEEEGLFEEDDEEEAGALALGDFADSLGEDYLGLRELGIAQEFGLSTLSIPKSLLRRKKAQKLAAAKVAEKPLDYPLPPPPPPFTYDRLPETIGLLRPYYEKRFELRARMLLPQPPPPPYHHQLPQLTGPTLGTPSVLMPPPPPPPTIQGYPALPGPTLPGPILHGPPPVPAPTTTPYPPKGTEGTTLPARLLVWIRTPTPGPRPSPTLARLGAPAGVAGTPPVVAEVKALRCVSVTPELLLELALDSVVGDIAVAYCVDEAEAGYAVDEADAAYDADEVDVGAAGADFFGERRRGTMEALCARLRDGGGGMGGFVVAVGTVGAVAVAVAVEVDVDEDK
ncbi:hypothetical protein NMY22_g18220 [Coprinellus aureogranulatus]|nr:hypothetical protein NMY22_g18220 [Coprinellus aureogranulatus]